MISQDLKHDFEIALAKKRLNIVKFAKKIHVTNAAVHRVLNGSTISFKISKAISDFINSTMDTKK